MGRYSHLSIEKREDVMIRWRDHEGIKPDREGGRPSPGRSDATAA